MNHSSHSSILPSAAAGSAVRCGCESGALVGPSGCSSSLLHGAPSHQIVPVDDAPALTSVAPGFEGDQRLCEMVRACAELNRHVTPPAGFASLSDWLLTLCMRQTIQAFFALGYAGQLVVGPLDKRGRPRKTAGDPLSGFTATDSKAHALRACKDLVEALSKVFECIDEMSAAVMTKPLTGLPIFRQLGFPATLLRHAIRLCGGAHVQSVFVQFARGIYNDRVARGVALPSDPLTNTAEFTLCFWLNYFARHHAMLALTFDELLSMIESLRQDAIFVPLLEDCELSLQPLIAQIVRLNMRMEQHHNRAQFPALFDGQHPAQASIDQAAGGAAASSVAASSRLVDRQAVLAAAAAAAGSASAGPSACHSPVPSIDRYVFAGAKRRYELSSPPLSPSLSSVGSARSSSSRASSLAPTSAASSVSRCSTPNQWYSMDDDDNGGLMIDDPDLNLGSGTPESLLAEAHKRQRTSAWNRSDLVQAQHAPTQSAFDLPAAPLASPEAAVAHQPSLLAPSAPAMAGCDDPNAFPSWESFLVPHLRSGASSPVDSSSSSPRV